MLVVGAAFTTLGGLLGALIFRKDAPPPAGRAAPAAGATAAARAARAAASPLNRCRHASRRHVDGRSATAAADAECHERSADIPHHAEIDALLREDRHFDPPPAFAADAIVRDASVYDEAARDPEAFWARLRPRARVAAPVDEGARVEAAARAVVRRRHS